MGRTWTFKRYWSNECWTKNKAFNCDEGEGGGRGQIVVGEKSKRGGKVVWYRVKWKIARGLEIPTKKITLGG